MANYDLFFVRSALKDLEALPAGVVLRARRRILLLAHNPRPRGSQKLRGARDVYRIRFGIYRVIYQIDDDNRRITVLAVAHRKDIYRGL